MFRSPNNPLVVLTMLCMVVNCLPLSAHDSHPHKKGNNQHSLMGSHGMVIVHHEKHGLFASHLPLYSTPHDYQIIYRIKSSNDPLLIKTLKQNMVTVLPVNFDLNRLINREAFSIKATFFDGHFERGGANLFDGTIAFDKPILIKQLAKTFVAKKQAFYIQKIDHTSAIYAHHIQSRPSFDAIGFVSLNKLPTKQTQIWCDKPEQLTQEQIKTSINKCGLPAPSYTETQDFK